MSLQELRVACFGLNERDVQIVQSLVRIVGGRKKLAWTFVETPAIRDAEVLFLMSEAENAGKIYADRRKNAAHQTIIVRPAGVFPREHDPSMPIARYPLRAMELLDIFDVIERGKVMEQRMALQKTASRLPAPGNDRMGAEDAELHKDVMEDTGVSVAPFSSLEDMVEDAAKKSAQSFRSTFREPSILSEKPAPALEWARPDIKSYGNPRVFGEEKPLDLSDLNESLGETPYPVAKATKGVNGADVDLSRVRPPAATEKPAERNGAAVSAKAVAEPPKAIAKNISRELPKPATAPNPVPVKEPVVVPPLADLPPEKPRVTATVAPLPAAESPKPASVPQPKAPPPAQVVTSNIRQLVAALSYIKEYDADFHYLDIYDHDLGWIGRVKTDKLKVLASSRFLMLDRKNISATGKFGWRLTKHNIELQLPAGDTLMIIDREMFFWQIACQYAYSLALVSLPFGDLKLSRWPDFGILPELSGCQGILLATALLSRGDVTLKKLSEESRADETDLSRLVGMSWLCDWLTITPFVPTGESAISPAAREKAASMPKPERRFTSVVRRLRQFLGLNPSRG
ncbi:MAG: hypothetical protein LBG61_07595 [Burkholderiales bacterium]|jgi:hypothetical protein|nr:hypothetical protein [Burkholderiales bacterium]